MFSKHPQSFTMSHSFKSKSSSSRRTIFCAGELNIEMKNLFIQYSNLQIFLKSRKINLNNPIIHGAILENKFQFVKESKNFFLLPHLASIGTTRNTSLSEELKNQVILFSGKSDNKKEFDVLKSQFSKNTMLLNIYSNQYISVINTINGGTYYHGNKFMFCLLPREVSIKFNDMRRVIESLNLLQRKKPQMHSNRGKKHSVFFENIGSNYVDLGIGACRFMPGLYKRVIKGVNNKDYFNVENYFKFVNDQISHFLPKCLLKRFNEVLNEINLDDLSKLQSYKEQKLLNLSPFDSVKDKPTNTNVNFNFMPSASFGSNNMLPLHTDQDMFLSVVHVHCLRDLVVKKNVESYELDNNIVKYFSFDNGISVGMRSGDLLVFNPIIPHCVSSCRDEYMEDKVYCVSHYFKSLIAGRNNNSIDYSI